uniref:Uncharacterized protein n=1 Tax=Anguilla anguilla TaxID=7936 RepID=A0A0E9RZZ2_ANGAN
MACSMINKKKPKTEISKCLATCNFGLHTRE